MEKMSKKIKKKVTKQSTHCISIWYKNNVFYWHIFAISSFIPTEPERVGRITKQIYGYASHTHTCTHTSAHTRREMTPRPRRQSLAPCDPPELGRQEGLCPPPRGGVEGPEQRRLGAGPRSPTGSCPCCCPGTCSWPDASSSCAAAATPGSSPPARRWGRSAGGLSVEDGTELVPSCPRPP